MEVVLTTPWAIGSAVPTSAATKGLSHFLNLDVEVNLQFRTLCATREQIQLDINAENEK